MQQAEFYSLFEQILTLNGLEMFIKPETVQKFYLLTEHMLKVNEHMNLTAITDMHGIITKHYADSLSAAKYLPHGASLIDIGCGAGFPSLPLAIARPDLKITSLDSTAKRIHYIEQTAQLLELDNITCVVARAEELAMDADYRERYDIACARAVARLNVLCELCIPYVSTGGAFIAMKANAESELDEAANAIKKLGGKLESADEFSLIGAGGEDPSPRCIISVRKTAPTPKNYPRNNSQIKKKPL